MRRQANRSNKLKDALETASANGDVDLQKRVRWIWPGCAFTFAFRIGWPHDGALRRSGTPKDCSSGGTLRYTQEQDLCVATTEQWTAGTGQCLSVLGDQVPCVMSTCHHCCGRNVLLTLCSGKCTSWLLRTSWWIPGSLLRDGCPCSGTSDRCFRDVAASFCRAVVAAATKMFPDVAASLWPAVETAAVYDCEDVAASQLLCRRLCDISCTCSQWTYADFSDCGAIGDRTHADLKVRRVCVKGSTIRLMKSDGPTCGFCIFTTLRMFKYQWYYGRWRPP